MSFHNKQGIHENFILKNNLKNLKLTTCYKMRINIIFMLHYNFLIAHIFTLKSIIVYIIVNTLYRVNFMYFK